MINGSIWNIKTFVKRVHPLSIKKRFIQYYFDSIYTSKLLRALHSYLFDPAWLCNDAAAEKIFPKSVCFFNEFFQEINGDFAQNMFPGAFTYHIHLKNCISNDEYSYFNYLKSFYNKEK